MLLADIRDWLKTVYPEAEHYYCGKLDNKQSKSIGVYQRKNYSVARVPIGGIQNKGYGEKQVSILVHWTNNATETEKAALQLYDRIQQAKEATIGGKTVSFIRMDVTEPVDVGTDDNGIYERVVWMTIIYQED